MDTRPALGWLLALGLTLLPASSDGRTLREPAFGLPHFFAETDLELARENGREIARDRLGQLILLARVGRGTLAEVFAVLDPGLVEMDVETRQTGYTSSELNRMWARLPAAERELILAYCAGVNDTIERIYAGDFPEPIEINLLRLFGLQANLFGNAHDLSDQVDPFYVAPSGGDPEHPLAGFQFTPEMAMAVAVLQVRNFGFQSFDEARRLAELQALQAEHGEQAGAEIWDDLNFLVDPLAPVSVPDPSTPGFGGPLVKREAPWRRLVGLAARFPRHDWAAGMRAVEMRRARREAVARRLGAWPALGSYAWAIAGSRSATGHPWIGGFPQTGIQTPSIMHFAENRSGEGIAGVGMEFVGGPFILIGHTDRVAYTTTTAQLQVVDTFFETLVNEETDALRYLDEGERAPLSRRTEVIFTGFGQSRELVFWRSHARGGDGGSRPVIDFQGDAKGTAAGGSRTALVASDAFSADLAGGWVALVAGTGAGQLRRIAEVPDPSTLAVGSPWTTVPDATTDYVAVGPGGRLVAVAIDSLAWLEESTAALAFSRFQRARSILDVRSAVRLIPSTHNFLAADNRKWNGIGTRSDFGNIGYWSSGYARVRQGGEDPRLPLDGREANPLVMASGVVKKATRDRIQAPGAFRRLRLEPPPVNLRYADPEGPAAEYVITITAGAAAKQTRRIARNTGAHIIVEHPFGVVPQPGDRFEVYEVLAMPEAVNPVEGYTANWNNKAATFDPGEGFGRQHRVSFILERLAGQNAWDRAKQRQLNEDVAGLDGEGRFGRFLIPRLRQAVDAVGADAATEAVLDALETHDGPPQFGRSFVDPVAATMVAGELPFLDALIRRLSEAIYADELAPLGAPGGSRGLALVQHAIDSAAGDLSGAYRQRFSGDYFGGAGWEAVVRDALAAEAVGGIPEDRPRPVDRYDHPLAALDPQLRFPTTPTGNRGTWEQIVEVGPTVKGEFIFPLGQSGHIGGTIAGAEFIDADATSLHPIWRDWRFVPMLALGEGESLLAAFERWYFGEEGGEPGADADGDGLDLNGEFLAGSDPTSPDTDEDGVPDGADAAPQDRLVH